MRRAVLTAVLLLVPFPLFAAEARITYLTASSAYVDAGEEQGLVAGARLEVVRDGKVVAVLTVHDLSPRRAACTIEPGSEPLQLGDAVTFTPAAPSPPAEAAPAAETSARRSSGLHGRVGARWLAVSDRTGFGSDLSQPALDLRLDGTQVGGAPIDLSVDIRARRSTVTPQGLPSESDDRSRVYRLAGSYRHGGARVTLGRQVSPSLAVVSLFDGALGEYRKPRWATGLFLGTEPDEDFGYSTDRKQAGAYAEWGSVPGSATRWALTGGAVTSTQEGEINRDFVFVQGRLTSRRIAAWLTQEVDVNRGWRQDAEGESWTPTGTFASIRLRATEAVSFDASYDDRRNVRLYRDLVTPETEFDDAHRRGWRLGAEWRPGRWLVGLSGRTASGGDAGDADSADLVLGLLRWTRHNVSIRSRTTFYDSPYVEGLLEAISAGMDLGSRSRLSLTAGLRDEDDLTGFDEDRTVHWLGLDADVLLQDRWFLYLSAERTDGGDEDRDQLQAAVSYRF